jgi:hypothetical protein
MIFGTSELVEYQSLLGELKRRLGLGCIMIYERDELMPYYILILRHLLEIFITEELENPESIKRFIELYDSGQDQIIGHNLPEMLVEYTVTPYEPESFSPILWVDAWVEIMKTVYVQLAQNYAYLFTEEPHGCQCSCQVNGDEYVLPEKTALGSKYIQKGCGCGG